MRETALSNNEKSFVEKAILQHMVSYSRLKEKLNNC